MSLKNVVKKKNKEKHAPGYIGLLNEYLESLERKDRPGYHPSEISYRFCPKLEALYQLGMVEKVKDIDAKLQRIFDNGHYMHHRFQKWTIDMGLEVDHPEIKKRAKVGKSAEVKLKHDVGISSSCDHILQIEPAWWDVVDYKSINPHKFSTLIQPIDYHEKQLTVYMGLVDRIFDGDPPCLLRGRMVYENKADQAMKEFIVPWDSEHQELFDSLIHILSLVNEAIEYGDPDFVDCTCGKCPTDGYEKLKEKPKKVKV